MPPDRPEDETLALLRKTVEQVADNPAVAAGGPHFTLNIEAAPVPSWSVVEPAPRDLRDLVQLLRHLDMPSSDIRLERVYPMLERRAAPDWLEGLASARQAFLDGQEPDTYRVQDPDDPPVLPGEDRTGPTTAPEAS